MFIDRDASAQREILCAVIEEWKLAGGIVAVVSDNESATCCAIESPLQDIAHSGASIRCGCHTLQLAVRAACELKVAEKGIEAARNIAIHFHSCSKWGDILEREAKDAKFLMHRTILDVEAR